MKNIFNIGLAFGISTQLFAGESHDAHEHGVAELQIAVEGKKISFVLEAPSETFYGFEHEAKTEKDKKAMNDALSFLKSKFDQIVILDSSLGCKISNQKLEVEAHGDHAEVSGEWTANCEKSPAKSSVQFDFSKQFSRIHSLKIDLLSDQKQGHVDLKKGNGKVSL